MDHVFYHGPVYGCDNNDDINKLIKCLQVQYPVMYDTGANCFVTDRQTKFS